MRDRGKEGKGEEERGRRGKEKRGWGEEERQGAERKMANRKRGIGAGNKGFCERERVRD
jgi:hypothetical protein